MRLHSKIFPFLFLAGSSQYWADMPWNILRKRHLAFGQLAEKCDKTYSRCWQKLSICMNGSGQLIIRYLHVTEMTLLQIFFPWTFKQQISHLCCVLNLKLPISKYLYLQLLEHTQLSMSSDGLVVNNWFSTNLPRFVSLTHVFVVSYFLLLMRAQNPIPVVSARVLQ